MILYTGIFSCSKQDKPKAAAGLITLSLGRDTVYTHGAATVAATISISNAGQLNTLIIRKGTTVMKNMNIVPAAKAGSSYAFRYRLRKTDEEQFNVSFSATGKDDKVYDTKFLHVDTRTGLVPLSIQMVARETGRPLATERVPAPNKTAEKYDVGCTDLGIMWKTGNGHVGIFFGDTQGNDFLPSAHGDGNGSKVKGFLHWGYHYWHKVVYDEMLDPLTNGDGGCYPAIPYGDPFVVYSGDEDPLSSVRWEVFAESLQDYALLQSAGIDPDDPMFNDLHNFADLPKTEQWLRQTLNTVLKK